MTATIEHFVTREEAGLRKPESVSRNIDASKGGVAGHYGGPSQPGAGGPRSDEHEECIRTWKAWQNYHMDTHGWVDIGYTGGYCNHGVAFAGRGEGVRPAAQGWGNGEFYAIVWIGGEGQTPTQKAYNAFEWWLKVLRKAGAGLAVKAHSFFMKTKCAGKHVTNYIKRFDGKALVDKVVEKVNGPRLLRLEKPYQRGNDVRDWQKDLNEWASRYGYKTIVADGFFGPQTQKASSLFVQYEMDVKTDDPRIGPKSRKAMSDALARKSPQKKLNEIVSVLKEDPSKIDEVHKKLGLK
jgi:hypothetical protein